MSRNELCFCGSGKKAKKCHIDIYPESKLAMLIKLYRDVDSRIESYHNEHQTNIPCRKGCSHCCYDDFSISLEEISLIMKYVSDHWSQEKIEALFEKAFVIEKEYEKEKSELHSLLVADGNKDQSVAIKSIMLVDKRNISPCPFLDENNGCSVYDVRPLVCRSAGSASVFNQKLNQDVDPEVCEFIPSEREHRKTTPNVYDAFVKAEDEILGFYYKDQHVTFRKYPIFYWMRVFFKKNGMKKSTKVFEPSLYNTSSEASNRNAMLKIVGR